MERRAHIDERIKILLTTTDLTFKQIIGQLKCENISVSFNTIRRVNRNHCYRKPRYEAKLSPQQRKELIVILKNSQTKKPNLSSLARRYGVCHGSIWYWWDKLSKISEKNNGFISSDDPALELDDFVEQDLVTCERSPVDQFTQYEEEVEDESRNIYDDDPSLGNLDSDPLDLDIEIDSAPNDAHDVDKNNIEVSGGRDFKMVGAVQAKNLNGEYVRLPILMYSSLSETELEPAHNWQKNSSISACSSSTNHSGSLLMRFNINGNSQRN